MIFGMFTTFFGPHSFGGDAAFVDRLSRALARNGHEVHVIYCEDAFRLVQGSQTPRPYEPPPGVTIHPLRSRFGPLSPLGTHQTGRPVFKSNQMRRLLDRIRPDVLHFHNLSLIGGPGLLGIPAGDAVRLMTTHEHWLVCPEHVLWKAGEGICQQPTCVSCCLKARKPPQLWRKTSAMADGLSLLDALIAPSVSTIREHQRRGVTVPMTHLPYFLPHDYTGLPEVAGPRHDRPYLAMAGRLELIKGFQDVAAVMDRFPGLDLRIAGTGAYEGELRRLAADRPNVIFEGRLDSPNVAALFREARAVVVPSLVYETFGYVVLEAFQERTPVIVRELGALPELVEQSRGGLTFSDTAGLIDAIGRVTRDERLRDELGENGHRARHEIWSEAEHLKRYLGIIEGCRLKSGLGSKDGSDLARHAGPRKPSRVRESAAR